MRYRPDLKPCPFCGGVPYENSCDVLISIGCDVCDYHICGHGVLTSELTTVPANKSHTLFYDAHAHECIEAKWNRRI